MPVRLSKDWQRTVRAVARLELSGEYPGFQVLFDNYPPTMRKAIREIKRRTLRELQRAQGDQQTPGELLVALSDFVARRQIQEQNNASALR